MLIVVVGVGGRGIVCGFASNGGNAGDPGCDETKGLTDGLVSILRDGGADNVRVITPDAEGRGLSSGLPVEVGK